MTHFEIVKKLIGEVNPAGASHLDTERFENLKNLCDLAHQILTEIDNVSQERNRPENSVKKAGQYAYVFLKNIEITE